MDNLRYRDEVIQILTIACNGKNIMEQMSAINDILIELTDKEDKDE